GRRVIPRAQFGKAYTGVAVAIEPAIDFTPAGGRSRGAFRYLRPMLRQGGHLRRILVTSIMLRAFALVTPLLTAILVNRIVPAADTHLLVVVSAGLGAVVYVVLLGLLSPPLALLVLGIGVVQVIVLTMARRRNQRLMMESLETVARSQSYSYQLLAGIEDLKAAGAERRAVEHWTDLFV